jgi:DNA repair protein RadA/Sms
MMCPSCKMPNLPTFSELAPEVVRMSEANTGKQIDRVSVGIYNPIFGGGLARTSVNMIAGQPGAGKTTLFLSLIDFILDEHPEFPDALYMSCEQSNEELSNVYGARLKLKHMNRILLYCAMGGLQRSIEDILDQYKPSLFVLDSLTRLVGEDMSLGTQFTELFKAYTVKAAIPSLIVNQVNKSGDHAGFNKMLHAGDSILHLEVDEVSKKRLLYSTKNRFGPAPVNLGLLMTPEDGDRPGYLVVDPEFDESELG